MNTNKYVILALINNSKITHNLQNLDDGNVNTNNPVLTDLIKNENISNPLISISLNDNTVVTTQFINTKLDDKTSLSESKFTDVITDQIGFYSELINFNGGITGTTASFLGLTIDNEDIVFSKLPKITAEITDDNADDNSIATTKFVNDKINSIKTETINNDTEQFSKDVTFTGDITGTTASFLGLTIDNEDIVFSKLPKITAEITDDNADDNSIATTKFVNDKINSIKTETINNNTEQFSKNVTFNDGIIGTTASFSDTIIVTKSSGASIICILPEYDTNQLAIDDGLSIGSLYRTGGVVKIVI